MRSQPGRIVTAGGACLPPKVASLGGLVIITGKFDIMLLLGIRWILRTGSHKLAFQKRFNSLSSLTVFRRHDD